MKVKEIKIDLFAFVFTGIAIMLGALGLVSWWVILLVLLSRFHFTFTVKF